MGKFAEQQKMKDEARDRERLSRETLGKFFYDLAKLAFTAMVLGSVVSLFSKDSEAGQIVLLACGTIVTSIFAYIGYSILK